MLRAVPCQRPCPAQAQASAHNRLSPRSARLSRHAQHHAQVPRREPRLHGRGRHHLRCHVRGLGLPVTAHRCRYAHDNRLQPRRALGTKEPLTALRMGLDFYAEHGVDLSRLTIQLEGIHRHPARRAGVHQHDTSTTMSGRIRLSAWLRLRGRPVCNVALMPSFHLPPPRRPRAHRRRERRK